MKNYSRKLIFIWFLPYFLALVLAQDAVEKSHSTSVAGMVQLLELETQLIDNLNRYADKLESKLKIVRSGIAEMSLENAKAALSIEEYLSNPLIAFSLIRRMNRDWINWELYMDEPIGTKEIDFLQDHREFLPTSTDLEEASAGFELIQTTYGLNSTDMAKGLLNGKQYDARLSVLDMYAIGQYHYDQENYGASSAWLYLTIENHKQNPVGIPLQIDFSDVLLLYAEVLVKLNRYKDAVQVINVALKDKKFDAKLIRRRLEIETLIRNEPNIKPKPFNKSVGDFERGCRGEFPALTDAKLYCIYNTTSSPFLRLAPLKMELIGLDPYMVLYHDVISPNEIAELQEMAKPELKRATVYNSTKNTNQFVKTRTAKVAWFLDTFNQLTERLNQRIMDMTNFVLNGSEMLQVMNYGLGGYYVKHFDYFNTTTNPHISQINGDRIATVLFYLNDVEQGGATVFPEIKKAVFPKRGSAIMWYNLKDDGEGNRDTLHAACPVIVGSKWVCNKWIREREQIFRRPCLVRK
ncbi:prolyl 4-hydroxylase subunit alpha-2-like isoform X3 [Drosophila willistoni]|uniref:prolyl 4-hydroxylase subunit alpha-2-like isoform X3 n=1 Tax=Drosophila willistoni TaxID=7260 RepID=UPI00017D94F7|nr:prolyl 4-hydroxylase subunit alpha-2-like isoform X3 [Drosophila willistoni]